MKELIAKDLLDIKAVFLRPNEPFTWASGIKSPIYCDNRLTLSYPNVRKDIENGFFVFFEKNFLGISIPISNALGDHFEIMIAYEELAPFKKEKAQ